MIHLRRILSLLFATAAAGGLIPAAVAVAQAEADPASPPTVEPIAESPPPPAGSPPGQEPAPAPDEPAAVVDPEAAAGSGAAAPAADPAPPSAADERVDASPHGLARPTRSAKTGQAPRALRGAPPAGELDAGAICAGALDESRCASGVDLLAEACAREPDPQTCVGAAAGHACLQAPRSIECLAFLDTPCEVEGTLACILGEGLIEIHCSRTPQDRAICSGGPTCCSVEPVGPDGPRFLGTKTLASNVGGPPETLGIADPGATGDAGLEARPASADRDRGALPLTGFPLLGLAFVAALLWLSGAAVGARAVAVAPPGSLKVVDVAADGRAGVQGIAGASGLAVSPDSRHVYVTGSADDSIATFKRTPRGLVFVESDVDGENEGSTVIDGLEGAAGVAASADGKNVYVASPGEDAVATFARTARSGRLRFAGVQRDGVDGVEGLAGANGVAVTPDGAGVYVAGFDDGAVTSFMRASGSGLLEFAEHDQVPELLGAFSVAAAPDSAAVYVTGFAADKLVAFRRDSAGGGLEFASASGTPGVLWPSGPIAVAASPYGRDVYAGMFRDSALNRFRRSVPEQALNFTGFVKDGIAGTNGIAAISGIAIAPDGSGAYATGTSDDALAFFSIRDTTGALRFRARYRNGRAGVHGLDAPSGIAVAPDGRRVYTIANGGARDKVAAFARRRVPLLSSAATRRAQRLRKLKVVVRCSRSCGLRARAVGVGGSVRFASGRFTGRLEDDVRHRIRLRFHRSVLRALRGEHADAAIRLVARDRLGDRTRRTLRVEIVP